MFSKRNPWYWFGLPGALMLAGWIAVSSTAGENGASPREATADRRSSQSHEPMLYDFLRTSAGAIDLTRQPIAGRHFGEGSPGFAGNFSIVGKPFGPKGPFEFGNADVAIMRMGPTRLPGVGESVEFPVLLAAVSWQSAEPVEIATAEGAQLMDVDIRLSRMASQPRGKMILRRDHAGGGTVDFEMGAHLVFDFRGRDGAFHVDSGQPGNYRGQAIFRASGVPWTLGCSSSAVRPARLSDDICIGESGPGTANLAIAAAPVALSLEPARKSIELGGAQIEASAFASSTAQLGRGVVLQVGARVLDGVALGRDVVVMPATTISRGALIGRGTRVGRNAFVGPGAYVGERVEIGTGARIEANAVIQDGVRIGRRAIIGAGAYVGARTQIGDRAVIESLADVGADSSIGSGATVKERVRLHAMTVIGPIQIQPTNTIQCMFPNYTWIATTIRRCQALGGAIRGHVPPVALSGFGSPLVSYTLATQQVPQSNGGGGGGQLGRDVDASGVAPANGGQPYREPDNDCDDFADDLEQSLQDRGYNATFTCLWTANSEHEWYNWLWTPEWASGHCLTDVHNDDGSYTWIEAQWSAGQGAVGQNLDANGDGMVGVSNGPGTDLTEGNTRIEVYGSAAEAEAAGVVLD